MPATHEQKTVLAELPLFKARVRGAVQTYASQTVGPEAMKPQPAETKARFRLLSELLRDPDEVAARFARGASGAASIIAAYVPGGVDDAAKLVNITDAMLDTLIAQMWNPVAGIDPWTKG